MNLNLKAALAGLVTAVLLFTVTSNAQTTKEQQADIEKVRAEIVKMIPLAADAEIVATPAKGIYRLEVQNQFVYSYVSGDYVLLGDLLDTKSKQNLGELATSGKMKDLIDGVSNDNMIVYGPKDAKRHITVLTDISCGYCQKLHRELPELNKAGIQVRYLAFPRAGIGSKDYKNYVSVWCSDDQQQALTDAKAGKSVPAASCDNPVEDNYNLGLKAFQLAGGRVGTPMIILDNGTTVPGYRPYGDIINLLGTEG